MKKILIADRDESLKDAFRVVFPSDEYEIIFTSNGKDIERISEEHKPEIYIINATLDKKDGTEVYKEMKEKGSLQGVRFFFMRDEGVTIDFPTQYVEGIIEKPINFFKVHQMIDKEDTLLDIKPTRKIEEKVEEAPYKKAPLETGVMEPVPSSMEEELKNVISNAIEVIRQGMVERIVPIISKYIEENARQMLSDTAEKVIREEMERLLIALRGTRR
ncbi:MAG: response regulator [Syntrophorhabdaceae bacterium]|nr:response regulator [Syntrophorhabdaceae bacterium]